MDCAAEESLMGIKLSGLKAVRSLDFNLSARKVAVNCAVCRQSILSAKPRDVASTDEPIPEATVRAAHAFFPKGNCS